MVRRIADQAHNMEQKQPVQEVKFGTFGGVFTPSVLTIIGVVLFLRTGWMVGTVGLPGAMIIIVLAHSVTVATGLSLSSIATNIRIGAGGAYTIIARSLGLEVGGAIGIPLYISQAISTAFYIAGFTEAARVLLVPYAEMYGYVYNDQYIAIGLWAILSIVAYIGADWALKIQYLIMACIAVSIASFFMGSPMPHAGRGVFTVAMGGQQFFDVFKIFFPAVTGILAGVSMSGDLKDPKRAIPSGTLFAIIVGFFVYAGCAYWYGRMAPADALRTDNTVMLNIGMFSWAFYTGIFAATLSSALGSLVSAPRTLNALGAHGILPFSRFFAVLDRKGQPRNAIVFTSLLSLVFVAFGKLDTIAPLLTMFYLITYGMLNMVTFIERSIGIVSFRPTFRVPRAVSLYGAVSCFFIMIVIQPIIGTLALCIIAGIYVMLIRAGLRAKWGDVRSGLFLSIATWAARQAAHLPKFTKSWTPNLLMPVKAPRDNALLFQLARDLAAPGGSVIAFSVAAHEENREKRERELHTALDPIRREKMFYIAAALQGQNFTNTTKTLTQFLGNIFLKPNILFATVSENPEKDEQLQSIINAAESRHMGLALLKLHPKSGLNQRREINLVLRDKSPNKDLAILLALQLQRNWERGRINLVTLVPDEAEHDLQADYFANLKEDARMPANTDVRVIKGKFPEGLEHFPRCDIAICGIGDRVDLDQIRRITSSSHVSCLFVKDSGEESAFD